MIYFQDWWSYGDNCILDTFKGFLAVDKKINDVCIYEEDKLNIFIDSIAKEITVSSGKKGPIKKQNKDDVFLNGKIKVDFNKQILFVFSEANIKEIVYSKMFECYLITYSEEPAEVNTYLAVLAKKIYPPEKNYYIVNDTKKDGDNDDETINNHKEENKKEDNTNNVTREFIPKFETLNNKPKANKSIIFRSGHED